MAHESTDQILAKVAHAQDVNLEEIAPDQRPQVIAGLKRILKEKEPREYDQHEVRVLLVALKDDETIRDCVNQYHADFTKGGDILRRAANAEIIPFVVPDLALPEDTGRKSFGDVYIPPTRVWAAELILRCIARSPEFPAATQAWAGTLRGSEQDDWAATSQWWAHNIEAVLAKSYASATWLPPRS